MKKILTIILALLPILAFSQIKYDSVRVVKPQNFVEAMSIDTAIVQIISQKAGANRRVNFQTVADWILAQQPNLDSAQYANDTLLLFYGPDTIMAVIPSGTIDTAYLSGDTLGIVFAGDTTEVVLAGLGDGNGIFDAANDGDTTAVASVVLGQDFTVDMDGNDWLFDGLVEDDTTSRIMTLRGDGSLAYRWLDSLLNGYTTGSGTPGTLPIWTGAYELGNSSLTEASGVLSSSLTGAFGLAKGTDAQRPVGVTGQIRYSTTGNGIEAWNGSTSTWNYLPWAAAAVFSNQRIAYSNGTSLTSHANLLWTGTQMVIGTTSPTLSRTLTVNGDVGAASYYSSTGRFYPHGAGTSLSHFGISTDADSRQEFYTNDAAKGVAVKLNTSTPVVKLGYVVNTEGLGANFIMPLTQLADLRLRTHRTIGAGCGTGQAGNIIIEPTEGRSSTNGGNVLVSGGGVGFCSEGVNTGTSGLVYIQTYFDHGFQTDSAFTKRNHMIFSGRNGRITTQLYHLEQTTSGIRTLTMESDTVKYRIENLGAISTSTDGSGDITVAHGMGVTPTVVDIQFTGTSGSATPYVYVVLIDGTDATNFTIRVFDMTGAAVTSTAVTATWHCKT